MVAPKPMETRTKDRKHKQGSAPKAIQSHKNISRGNGMPCWMYTEEQVVFWKTSKYMREIQIWAHN